jgi:tetratricopeptide (TPR) repeat protein
MAAFGVFNRISRLIHRETESSTGCWILKLPNCVRLNAASINALGPVPDSRRMAMQTGLLVLYLSSALAGQYAAAQDIAALDVLGAACIDLNQTAMNYTAVGRLTDAESTLSAALADAIGSKRPCSWLILHNLATVIGLSGRFVEAEAFETRSLEILENSYPPGDPALLRPLQSLAQIQLERRQIAKVRQTFQRLQSIRAQRPSDRAVIQGLGAVLLYAEGRYHEAEAKYLKSLEAWEESGRGQTPDAAAVLDGLAAVYVADARYREAGRTLDRAIAILTSAKDTVATDWIKLFSTRAELHVRQRQWREAEADLGAAISAADNGRKMDPALVESLLAKYAYVLRKNHRRGEARSIEARAAALQTHGSTNGVVDISELLAKIRANKK